MKSWPASDGVRVHEVNKRLSMQKTMTKGDKTVVKANKTQAGNTTSREKGNSQPERKLDKMS